MRVLVAEDDPDIQRYLVRVLQSERHVVDACASGADALWYASEVPFDAITLDVNLPPPDGFEVCRRLRTKEIWTPVILLTGRGRIEDRVRGLDAGADDYLAKPFSKDELMARLRAVTRREQRPRPAVLAAGDLVVDPARREVRRGDTVVPVTAREFALLELLVRECGAVVSRSQIRDKLWDFAFEAGSNVIDVTVRRLRQKVDEPFGRSSIKAVRGVGYLVDPAA